MKRPELPYLLQQPPLQTAYNHKQDKHIHMRAVNNKLINYKIYIAQFPWRDDQLRITTMHGIK